MSVFTLSHIVKLEPCDSHRSQIKRSVNPHMVVPAL